MKHNKKITVIILLMFLLTQFIGLYVINEYLPQKTVDGSMVNQTSKLMPYGLEPIDIDDEMTYMSKFLSIFFSFIIAITLIFLLIKFRAKWILKTWFFLVTVVALGISFTAIFPETAYTSIIGILLAIPFAISKIFFRHPITHNLSEFFIYPGIAAIFIPLLSFITIIILLIIISLYDAWAVWRSGIMQKMAKYQMDELNIFSGFLIPYADKKMKAKIKKLKQQMKNKKITEKEIKKRGIKINLAILGGGDIIFPIITSGVMLKVWGLGPAIFVIFGAFFGLASLLLFSVKKKFYPAMPFITAGIFLGMIISWALQF